MRVPMAVFTVLLLAVALTPVVVATDSEAAAIYRQFIEAQNRDDVAGSLALFTDDGVLQAGGLCTQPCVGKEAIRAEFEQRVRDQVRVGILSLQGSGNTATFRLQITSVGIRLARVDAIIFGGTVEVRGDKISRITARSDANDPKTAISINFRAIAGPYQQYIAAMNRGDVASVMAVFGDNAPFDGSGICPATAPCVGKEAIQREMERRIANHATHIPTSLDVAGHTALARVEVRSDPSRAAGVERFIGTETVTVVGGRITAYRFRSDASDAQTAVFLAFLAAQQPPAAPAGLPRTGSAGLADAAAPETAVLAAVLGASLLAAGLARWRTRRGGPSR